MDSVDAESVLSISTVAGSSDFRAHTQQTITILSGTPYVVTCRARCRGEGLSMHIVNDDGTTMAVLVVTDTNERWQEFQGAFKVPMKSGRVEFQPVTLVIESRATADVAIDYIRIKRGTLTISQ